MVGRSKTDQFRAFCDELKDSLSIFEAWEGVQTGTVSSNAFAAQVAQRLKGGASQALVPVQAQPLVRAPKAPEVKAGANGGPSAGGLRMGNWGTVRDRTLEALRSGPNRCADIVRKVIELSPVDQRPEGEVEKKNHYTTVNNGLRAMVKDQYVVKGDREPDDGKTAIFWAITDKGRTYLAGLGK